MPRSPLLQFNSSTSCFTCHIPGSTFFLVATFFSAIFQDWDLPSILSPLQDTDTAPQSLLIHLTFGSSELPWTGPLHITKDGTKYTSETFAERCVLTTSNILNAALPNIAVFAIFLGRGGEVQKYDVCDFPDIAEQLEDNSGWRKDAFYKHRLSPAFHFL